MHPHNTRTFAPPDCTHIMAWMSTWQGWFCPSSSSKCSALREMMCDGLRSSCERKDVMRSAAARRQRSAWRARAAGRLHARRTPARELERCPAAGERSLTLHVLAVTNHQQLLVPSVHRVPPRSVR